MRHHQQQGKKVLLRASVTWVRASVAVFLHTVTSTLSSYNLIDATICHFEMCIEQKN